VIRGSLRLRLLVAWALLIALTLIFSAASLRTLYERGITRRSISDLTFDIDELKERLRITKSGKVRLHRFPTDPQFHIPFGGRYWQIFSKTAPVLSSRSLQGYRFDIPPAKMPGVGSVRLDLMGPRQQNILALKRVVQIEGAKNITRKFTLVAGIDKIEIKEDTDEFTTDITHGLIGIALLLMLAGWMHVSVGLSPLSKLKSVLAAVRAGTKNRIDEKFPDEVVPLIKETNSLLDEQDTALDAARLRAGNLAHGLKTPLSILAAESRSLRKLGAINSANQIDVQVENLRRHVERELALFKARGISKMRPNRLDACDALRSLCGALQKLPESEVLSWQMDLPDTAFVDVDRIDFNNIMGNLLDNARKWANATLTVQLQQFSDNLVIIVEDDGKGIPDDQIARLLKPSERGAPDVAGTGLGLAIVKDLVDVYKGDLGFSTSELGGARVWVRLPVGAP